MARALLMILALSVGAAFAEPNATASLGRKKVFVVGDSWAAIVAGGSKLGASFFSRKMKKHGCAIDTTNIAVPGTTASDWNSEEYMTQLKAGAKTHDYVWAVLMGNDALMTMPQCASSRRSAEKCGDELYASMLVQIGDICDAVREANPKAKVVGFGYDTMFGGVGCKAVAFSMFPQCLLRGAKATSCFNTQFLRIQQVWEDVAANRTWVDAASILGATQAAAGDAKAVVGKSIDMDKMGPAKYWPDYEACFHPGVLGGEDSGANVVMEAFYQQYWSKELGC